MPGGSDIRGRSCSCWVRARPSLQLASLGAVLCGRKAGLTGVLADIAASLGKGYDAFEATGSDDFIGPVAGRSGGPGAPGPRVLVPGALY